MSTTRIQEKLSSLVQNQLPEFIRDDFPTFVLFVEAYYKFLEQDQNAQELLQNSKKYNDVDQTIPSFIDYFLKTYSPFVPESARLDRSLLIKKIKYLYESKGSELSFELLFKILFNKDVSISYPNLFTLIPSDGRWSQRVSIQVETVFGDRNNIIDRFLTYKFQGQEYTVPIVDVRILTATKTEVFLDPVFLPPNFLINDRIEVRSASPTNNLIFIGSVLPIPTSYVVVVPGFGFFPGQAYTLFYNEAFGTVIQITEIDSNGGIRNFKFITFGQEYTTQFGNIFTLPFDSRKNVPGSFTTEINSATQGFGSSGIINYFSGSAQNYFLEDYAPIDYVTESFDIVFNDSTFAIKQDRNRLEPGTAIVTFSLGTIARYPGTFTTSNGFLDEPEVCIQDERRFQPFAYQTNTEQEISEFFDIVKQIVHPAGQVLFNNRIISTEINLAGNVSIETLQNVQFEALSTFAVSDEFSLTIIIPQQSGNIVLQDDSPLLNIFINQFEDIEIIESIDKNISILKDSDTVILDQVGVLQNQFSDAFGEFDSIQEFDLFKSIDPDTLEPNDFNNVATELIKEDDFETESKTNLAVNLDFKDVEEIEEELNVVEFLNKQDVIEPSEFTSISYNTEFNNNLLTDTNSNLNITVSFADSFGLEDVTLVYFLFEREFDDSQIFEDVLNYSLSSEVIENVNSNENSNNLLLLNVESNINSESELLLSLDVSIADTQEILEQPSLQYQLDELFDNLILEDVSNNLLYLNVESNFDLNALVLLELNIILDDTQKILEESSIQLETTINNSLPAPSDSASGLISNYAGDYFQELYVAEPVFNT